MLTASWLVVNLLLALPAEYKLVGTSSEEVPMALLLGVSAHQEFRRWEAPEGRALHVAYWQPMPAMAAPCAQWPRFPGVTASQGTGPS